MTDTSKSELETLKERADLMGIKYSPNIGVDTLRDKVNTRLTPKTEPETKGYKSQRMDAMKLIRVRVINLNPSKKESGGEFMRTGNSQIKTVSRFVPFDSETHVEQILLNLMKERQYCQVVYEKNAEGKKSPVRKMRKEFQIELLEPLTQKELDDLKESQIKRNVI